MLKAGGPRMHFETWKSRRRLNFVDWGVDTYELLCSRASHVTISSIPLTVPLSRKSVVACR
jgi:hypothetical protein